MRLERKKLTWPLNVKDILLGASGVAAGVELSATWTVAGNGVLFAGGINSTASVAEESTNELKLRYTEWKAWIHLHIKLEDKTKKKSWMDTVNWWSRRGRREGDLQPLPW